MPPTHLGSWPAQEPPQTPSGNPTVLSCPAAGSHRGPDRSRERGSGSGDGLLLFLLAAGAGVTPGVRGSSRSVPGICGQPGTRHPLHTSPSVEQVFEVQKANRMLRWTSARWCVTLTISCLNVAVQTSSEDPCMTGTLRADKAQLRALQGRAGERGTSRSGDREVGQRRTLLHRCHLLREVREERKRDGPPPRTETLVAGGRWGVSRAVYSSSARIGCPLGQQTQNEVCRAPNPRLVQSLPATHRTKSTDTTRQVRKPDLGSVPLGHRQGWRLSSNNQRSTSSNWL